MSNLQSIGLTTHIFKPYHKFSQLMMKNIDFFSFFNESYKILNIFWEKFEENNLSNRKSVISFLITELPKVLSLSRIKRSRILEKKSKKLLTVLVKN